MASHIGRSLNSAQSKNPQASLAVCLNRLIQISSRSERQMGKLFLDGSLVLKIDSEENKLTNPWAEEMREYYQRNYGSGFDYAYTYPAMAKAVQAAGRVIRSETDRGIIVLMDSRFTHPSYTRTMPTDWFQKSATELVSTGILKEVSDFWSADVKELDL